MKTNFFPHCVTLWVIFGWNAALLAMMPGPTIIRECPHCHVALSEFTLGSGNTIGARFWSDDKMDAPMLPEFPWLVKCSKCKKTFWIDEAKKLGEVGWGGDGDKKWKKLASPIPATAEDMQAVVAAGKLSKEKEVYLRKHLWWQGNNIARSDAKVEVQFTPEQLTNLLALAALMDEKSEPERLLKAEIYRELGDFDRCTVLLNSPFKTPGREQWAACLRKWAAQKIKGVREIKLEETRTKKAATQIPLKSGSKQAAKPASK